MKTLIKCALIALGCSLIFTTQTAAAQSCPNSGGITANFNNGAYTAGSTISSPHTNNLFDFATTTGNSFEIELFGAGSGTPALYPYVDDVTVDFPAFGGTLLANTGALWMYLGHASDQSFKITIYRRDSSGTVYQDTTWSGTYLSGVTSPALYEVQIPDPNDPFFNNKNYNTYISGLDPVEYVFIDFLTNENGFIKMCTW
jgi:hypothetical protein